MKKRLAFVVQRYGKAVNGGAEQHCRQLAEQMARFHEVDVLTTCAEDYYTWENAYPAGSSMENGVKVNRFETVCTRDHFPFPLFPDSAIGKYGYTAEFNWMFQQGPISFDLVNFIKYNKYNYDIFLFFTYLYFPTWAGIGIVPEKSILIPTAHDEDAIYKELYNSVFHLPRAIFYNTLEEKEFVEQRFHNQNILNDIGGVGVEVPNDVSGERFRKKYQIHNRFLLYVGRITEKKGCDMLFDYYKRLRREQKELSLVLLGKPGIPIPDDVISLGFVSDQDKFDAIAACECMVIPSRYESLSMVLLEAMMLHKPVLVNGECAVLRGHCDKSNGGLYHTNYEEFSACVRMLLAQKEIASALGENGAAYVRANYAWDIITDKLNRLIRQICE